MQDDAVHRDRGLAPVVDNPVRADGLRHPAAAQVQVDAEPGRDGLDVVRVWNGYRHRARRENRDPGLRGDAAPPLDDDPAATGEEHALRSAHHGAVHRDGLPAVPIDEALVRADLDWRDAGRCTAAGEPAHPDTLSARSGGRDVPSDIDGGGCGVHLALVFGIDAVTVHAGRSDGMAAARRDLEFAAVSLLPESSIDAVGIDSLRLDGAAPEVDVDVSQISMQSIDADGAALLAVLSVTIVAFRTSRAMSPMP